MKKSLPFGLTFLVCVVLAGWHVGWPVSGDLGIVSTDAGLISGVTNAAGDVHIYRGVPFVAPPVGNLRWKEPQPVTPWEGIRKCERFGPSAMQPRPLPYPPWTKEFMAPL